MSTKAIVCGRHAVEFEQPDWNDEKNVRGVLLKPPHVSLNGLLA